MATLEYSGGRYCPEVKCPGCGEKLGWTPTLLDSRVRSSTPFDKEHAKLGTAAERIAEFAERHKDCPQPQEEILPSGIKCISRRTG